MAKAAKKSSAKKRPAEKTLLARVREFFVVGQVAPKTLTRKKAREAVRKVTRK